MPEYVVIAQLIIEADTEDQALENGRAAVALLREVHSGAYSITATGPLEIDGEL